MIIKIKTNRNKYGRNFKVFSHFTSFCITEAILYSQGFTCQKPAAFFRTPHLNYILRSRDSFTFLYYSGISRACGKKSTWDCIFAGTILVSRIDVRTSLKHIQRTSLRLISFHVLCLSIQIMYINATDHKVERFFLPEQYESAFLKTNYFQFQVL